MQTNPMPCYELQKCGAIWSPQSLTSHCLKLTIQTWMFEIYIYIYIVDSINKKHQYNVLSIITNTVVYKFDHTKCSGMLSNIRIQLIAIVE